MKCQTILLWALAGLLVISCNTRTESLQKWVNPMVGTEYRQFETNGYNIKKDIGRVMPAVGVPHGMTNWVAQNKSTENYCLPPYYYFQPSIEGFRASHWINGSCTQDYGSVTLMPEQGVLKTDAIERGSSYDHSEEKSSPSLYTVTLKDYDIFAEMTGLSRSGIFRFDFKREGDHYFVIEPNSDRGDAFVNIDPERKEITGFNPVYRIYGGWGKKAGISGHFVVRFEDDFAEYGVWDSTGIIKGASSANGHAGAWVKLSSKAAGKIVVKMGTSFTSIDNARMNLDTEIPGWNFDKVLKQSSAIWDEALGKIRVEGNDEVGKNKFYTALYEALFHPREFSDVDGSYPKFAGGEEILKMESGSYYEDFSLWDTFRALHPLLTILYPSKDGEMANSLVLKGEQGGWMPIFPCWNSYTNCMIGDHCISMIGDAIMKDIKGFDYEKAYELMRKNAFEPNSDSASYADGIGPRLMDYYLRSGYIPLEVGDPGKPAVSMTLEYAYDDFVLAQVAKKLGKEKDFEILMNRARNYQNVIDQETGFARGRYADGRWIEDFDPYSKAAYICEGCPYHYTWYVPHDVAGLIEWLGGREQFTRSLDRFFDEDYNWHGNEPCHHVPYLSAYAGEQWKIAQRVHHILDTDYGTGPDGLTGNDDAGQMSAWLVMSMMGFYPVCPGMPYYVIGSPCFDKCVITLEDGKKFTIEAPGASDGSIYIQSAKLNGKAYDKSWISHEDIMKGGKLSFVMGKNPNKGWASSDESLPPSMDNIYNFQ